MSRKILRVDIELPESKIEEIEKLLEDDYDEAVDKVEVAMMSNAMIENIDVVELH